ncbi:MAG: phosphoribosylanthranilate isomerase [Pseudomonadota bacterium]
MSKLEFIKVCGLSTVDAIDAVIEGRATHAGFIFFEKSPRHVSLEKARALFDHAKNRILRVAVTVDAEDQFLEDLTTSTDPDFLQLHGSESLDQVQKIKQRFGLPIIKVFSVHTSDDLEKARPYFGVADHIMFDAKAPKGSEIPGGNGVAFDWSLMDQWPTSMPYILSGGLSAQNIRGALNQTGTKMIDVSSGVESSPGAKEPDMIHEFLAGLNQD